MLLIVARAWKITIVDSRRAASLRRLSPETGVCGEFLVVRGHGRAKEGMRYPVIREGLVGSSRKADIRLRSSSVRRVHAFFEITPKGLRLRAQRGARMFNARGNARRELLLGDGSRITFGQVELLLILTEAVGAPAETLEEGLFDVQAAPSAPASRSETGGMPIGRSGIAPESPLHRPDALREPDVEAAPRRESANERDSGRGSMHQSAGKNDAQQARSVWERDVQPRRQEPGANDVPEAPADLFMDGSAGTLKPGADAWDEDEAAENVIPWDDWEIPRRKRTAKKRSGDDDLFGV